MTQAATSWNSHVLSGKSTLLEGAPHLELFEVLKQLCTIKLKYRQGDLPRFLIVLPVSKAYLDRSIAEIFSETEFRSFIFEEDPEDNLRTLEEGVDIVIGTIEHIENYCHSGLLRLNDVIVHTALFFENMLGEGHWNAFQTYTKYLKSRIQHCVYSFALKNSWQTMLEGLLEQSFHVISSETISLPEGIAMYSASENQLATYMLDLRWRLAQLGRTKKLCLVYDNDLAYNAIRQCLAQKTNGAYVEIVTKATHDEWDKQLEYSAGFPCILLSVEVYEQVKQQLEYFDTWWCLTTPQSTWLDQLSIKDPKQQEREHTIFISKKERSALLQEYFIPYTTSIDATDLPTHIGLFAKGKQIATQGQKNAIKDRRVYKVKKKK